MRARLLEQPSFESSATCSRVFCVQRPRTRSSRPVRAILALAATFVLASFALLCPGIHAAEPDKKARVLMVTESGGFRHSSVTRKNNQLSSAEVSMTQLGQQTGLFEVHCTQDSAADFTKDNLQNYDIVMFYTTGALPISEADQDYFLNDWLKQKGHGFIGFHSATDTYRSGDKDPAKEQAQNEKYRWYWDMVGGTFDGHPWGSNNTVTVTVHDTNHPASRVFGSEFQITDEIYAYRNWQPEKVRVLMSLNMEKCEPKRPFHVPLTWVKNWGDGKVYYTNLGHNETTWTDSRFLKSTEGAIRWVLNLEEGDATPNPDVSQAEEAKAKAAAQ